MQSNVILYLRVSTDEQAEKGHSLQQQEESLKAYCKREGYNIIKIYKDDHSAKNFNRPEWIQLKLFVKANKHQINKVLFTKWDRFSRSSEKAYPVLSEFRKMGIESNAVEQLLDFTQSNYKMMLAVYLVQGEMERDNISDRTLKGTHQAKKGGYYCGKAPYGYDNCRDEFKKSILKPNQYAHFIRTSFEEVAKGIEPVEVIRKRLNKLGMNIQKSAFSDILKNIIYAGKIIVPEFEKEPMTIVEGRFEAIIDLSTFYKVQDVFRGKRWYGLKPSHDNENFPLRDFLTCEICGKQVTGSVSKGRSKKYGYYHCRNKCQTRVSIDQTHAFISGLLTNLQINNNIKELFKEVLKDTDVKYNGDKAKQLMIKLETQQSIKGSIIEAENMLLKRELAPERFNNIALRLNSDLMNVSNDIEILNNKNDSIKEYVDGGLEMLTNLNVLFNEGSYEDKRILAGSLFTEKVLLGNNGCRTTSVNEVLDVLTRSNKCFEEIKKGKAIISDSFSASVPGAGQKSYIPETSISIIISL
ncbi:MAG: recombinase family protein [Bacteroidota bacterium]